jgi:hypothetical protein
MKMIAFWDVAPYTLVEVYRRFRGACCLHHRCDRPAPCSVIEIEWFFRGDYFPPSLETWNVGKLLPDCTVQHTRRQSFSYYRRENPISHPAKRIFSYLVVNILEFLAVTKTCHYGALVREISVYCSWSVFDMVSLPCLFNSVECSWRHTHHSPLLWALQQYLAGQAV